MSQTVTAAKIVTATLAEEKTFEDGGDKMHRFEIDLELPDGTRRNDLNLWLGADHPKPPTEGEEGEFIIEPQKGRDGGFKVRRKPKAAGGGGGGYGGGRATAKTPDAAGYGYKTQPDDAERMSRSTAVSAAATCAAVCGLDSSQKVLGLAKTFADFIYNGPKEETS